ncbi:MAG: type VI secretion system-associated protein TagF [Allosphingosinicella sp.]
MSQAILFGKLPAHGDFVSRGLSPSERESLDGWLAAEVAVARASLEDAFEEAFDAAPPWRFAWREEAGDGEDWTAGALASSVDSVGRRFPLLLGCRGIAPSQALGAAEQCEEAIYAALSESWDAERLTSAASVPSSPEQAWVSEDCWWATDCDGREADRLGGRRPFNLILHILTCGEART